MRQIAFGAVLLFVAFQIDQATVGGDEIKGLVAECLRHFAYVADGEFQSGVGVRGEARFGDIDHAGREITADEV